MKTNSVTNHTVFLRHNRTDGRQGQTDAAWTVKRPFPAFLAAAGAAFLLALLLELLLFNFRWLGSLSNQPLKGLVPAAGSGMTDNGDGTYTVRSRGEPILEFTGIGHKLDNIHLDAEVLQEDKEGITAPSKKVRTFSFVILAQDEANTDYFELPEHVSSHSLKESQYFHLSLSGKSDKLAIRFSGLEGQTIRVHDISFNVRVPLHFSAIRLFVCFFLILFIYYARPESGIYRHLFDPSNGVQTALIFLMGIVLSVFLASLSRANPLFTAPAWEHHQQYQELAHSMADGHYYLDEEPSKELTELENPYDPALRKEMDVSYQWDTAYYNGRYYVYFGVTPELLFYLPYYLVTGNDLPNHTVVIIAQTAYVFGMLALMREFIKKYFSRIPFFSFLLLTVTAIIGSGAVYIAKRPDLYHVPIITALALTAWGLTLWISAVRPDAADGRKETSLKARLPRGRYSWPRMLAGSCCMAAVAGSRPQLLVGSLLALPLFMGILKKENRRELWKLLALALPYLGIAAFLMYYNYARFGSALDFGANYNLTTNDMTRRGFVPGRIPLGIFTYLLQPPKINARFPFLYTADILTTYPGKTIQEAAFGGLFTTNLILMALFAVRYAAGWLRKKKLFAFCMLCTAGAFLIVVADTEMAGILTRYKSDFGLFFFLPALLILFSLMEAHAGKRWMGAFHQVLFWAGFCSLGYHALLILAKCSYSWQTANPLLYERIARLVQFWL